MTGWGTVAAAAALATVAAVAAAGAEAVRLTAEEQARAGIVVAPVTEARFGDRIRVVGQVVRSPGSTVTVKTVVSGRVERILATPGAGVRAGQPLLRLHSHELHRLQSRLLVARQRARLAEVELAAGEQLLEIEGISRLELERRRQTALVARLEAEAAQAELRDLGYTPEAIEALLERRASDPHLEITAPAAGVVLELMVEEHEWVRAFEPLVVVGDPRRVELELQIPPDQASLVAAGDPVEFSPVGRPDLGGRAVVLTSVPQVDPTTRTIVIRARIESGARAVVPGVFVEGTLAHGRERRSPAIPEGAVARLGGSDVVFVRIGPDAFEAREVELGVFDGQRYEVRSGVVPGEEVVVRGGFFLKSRVIRTGGEDG